MTPRRQWTIIGCVLVVLAAGLFVVSRTMREELFPVTVGSQAPQFKAKVLGENRYKTLADYKGQVVLLNIWATYCIPCRTEMPSIQALHDRYAARGLKVVAVSIDSPGFEDEIRKFRDQYGLTFEILYDAPGGIKTAYQTTGVPETFVIGRDGVIRKKVIAADNWDSPANRALFAQMLGVPESAAQPGSDAPAAPVPVMTTAPPPEVTVP